MIFLVLQPHQSHRSLWSFQNQAPKETQPSRVIGTDPSNLSWFTSGLRYKYSKAGLPNLIQLWEWSIHFWCCQVYISGRDQCVNSLQRLLLVREHEKLFHWSLLLGTGRQIICDKSLVPGPWPHYSIIILTSISGFVVVFTFLRLVFVPLWLHPCPRRERRFFVDLLCSSSWDIAPLQPAKQEQTMKGIKQKADKVKETKGNEENTIINKETRRSVIQKRMSCGLGAL